MAVEVRHEEQLVKPSEVARRIGVHHNTILNWIREDRIPYVRTPTGQYLLPWALVVQSLSGTYDLSLPEPSDELSEEEAAARSLGR
jgi:excisionase family DNA binding protein